jgi:hypothetical protein
VASNPGQIPAGGKDKISVVVDTKNRGGSMLNKRFSVFTNDPKTASKDLVILGKVKGYVSVVPAFVRLMGRSGEDIHATIQITAEAGYPFEIKEVKARDGREVQLDLAPTGPDTAPKGYRLTVRNTRKEPGVFRDFIMITTDLKEKPMITIPVNGRIFEESESTRKPGKQ